MNLPSVKCLKYFLTPLKRLTVFGVLAVTVTIQAQQAKGANKFCGNITTRSAVRSDFMTYWNQISPENESKWGTVEGTRDKFNWARVDSVKNFAERNGIPWKFHTLVWGSQYPNWITSLSQADQLAEVIEWMDFPRELYPGGIKAINSSRRLRQP
jgi:GH35 family endo-1,4-beta-xylanase